MSDTFNFSRFQKFFKYGFRNAVASYGLTFLILACAPLWIEVLTGAFSVVGSLDHAWHGPSLGLRDGLFSVIAFIFYVSFPAKVYGFITEKRAGSAYLLIPASTGEKFVSMLLNCLIIFPMAFLLIYAGCDALVAAIDPTVDGTFWFLSFADSILDIGDYDSWVYISALMCVIGYVCTILFFLLGAIWFRRRKVSNTILVLLGIVMVLSMLAVWAANNTDFEFLIMDEEKANRFALIAVNSLLAIQTLVMVGLGTAIFFRLKTIRH